MRFGRSVLLVMLLLAGSLSPPALRAQATRSPSDQETVRRFHVEQNFPNPANPETWVPFFLDETLFEGSDSVAVTGRIINILNQVVAIPEAVDHPAGRGIRLLNLGFMDPGRKIAYWNGRDSAGRMVPSGVYYFQLVVRDELQTRKIIVLNPRRRRSIIPWFENPESRPR